MYLYIFEDGTLKQSDEYPTRMDLLSIEFGYLLVVQFRDGKFFEINENGTTWLEIDKASLETDCDGSGGSFHV